jgi:hypothetical protein
VFGSEGSNRDVVQLLDLTGWEPNIVEDHLDSMIHPPGINVAHLSESELCVLVVDNALRNDSRFVPPHIVASRSRPRSGPSSDPVFRHVPWLEAWFDGTIPWETVLRSVDLRKFLLDLRSGKGKKGG